MVRKKLAKETWNKESQKTAQKARREEKKENIQKEKNYIPCVYSARCGHKEKHQVDENELMAHVADDK